MYYNLYNYVVGRMILHAIYVLYFCKFHTYLLK